MQVWEDLDLSPGLVPGRLDQVALRYKKNILLFYVDLVVVVVVVLALISPCSFFFFDIFNQQRVKELLARHQAIQASLTIWLRQEGAEWLWTDRYVSTRLLLLK